MKPGRTMSIPVSIDPQVSDRVPLDSRCDEGVDANLARYPPFDTCFPGIEMLSEEPPVFLVHDFLSSDECDALRTAAEKEVLRRVEYSGSFVLLDREKLRPLPFLCLTSAIPSIIKGLENGADMPDTAIKVAESVTIAAAAMLGLLKVIPWSIEQALNRLGGGAVFTGTKWATDSLDRLSQSRGEEEEGPAAAAAVAYSEFLNRTSKLLQIPDDKHQLERPTVTRYSSGEFQRIHTDARPPVPANALYTTAETEREENKGECESGKTMIDFLILLRTLMYAYGDKGDPDGLEEFLANGGQRLAQCIVYLNSLSEDQEGQTAFHDKELGGLEVTPKKVHPLVIDLANRVDG